MGRMLPQPGWRRRIVIALFSLPACLLIYLAVAFALMLVPVNRSFQNKGDVSISLRSNGVHVDLILPVQHAEHDWRTVFQPVDFQTLPGELNYIAIGWGDAAFYLNTPQWQDLSIKTAAAALLGRNPSLLHVEYLVAADFETTHIRIDSAKYARLLRYVSAQVQTAPGLHHAQVVPGASYFGDDAFFESAGSYSAIHTCNSWVGGALRAGGVRMSAWTPFAVNVTGSL